MQRIGHGFTTTAKAGALATIAPATPSSLASASSIPFDYLFRDLINDPSNRLPETPTTLANLTLLGASMRDRDSVSPDSDIPSAYTYLGQFIDHDLSFTRTLPPHLGDPCLLSLSNLGPWPTNEVLARVRNQRASLLNLDSVYGGITSPPRKGESFVIGTVSKFHNRPPNKDDDNDLVREAVSEDRKRDRAARIGDPRNDQNLIISQLHLAFLRAHNTIVRSGHTWDDARLLLRQHYHWMIINDYLMDKIADPCIVKNVLTSATHTYNPLPGKPWLPLEFTVAAFRFGHSMIRNTYYLNRNFVAGGIPLEMLFTLTALSDNIEPTPGKGFPTLPENRIIEWRRFLTGGDNVARRIDTRLSKTLFGLLGEDERPSECERSLAVLDLKRGYVLGLPTGQAIAEALKLPVLTPAQIEMIAERDENPTQRQVLAAGFSSGTPLWFYILAEAAASGKQRLGPVGSRLVAEVLIGLIRSSAQSILDPTINPAWRPTLGTAGDFNLPDLLSLAGVLEP